MFVQYPPDCTQRLQTCWLQVAAGSGSGDVAAGERGSAARSEDCARTGAAETNGAMASGAGLKAAACWKVGTGALQSRVARKAQANIVRVMESSLSDRKVARNARTSMTRAAGVRPAGGR